MYAKFDKAEGTINLSPATSEEEILIDRIATDIKKGGQLEYNGRDGAEHGTPYTERMELFFKLGGDKVTLAASSDESEPVVRDIRDAIFFGGGGLHVVNVRFDVATGRKSLDVCVNFCQHCNVPLVKMGRVEWRTCEACVAKCEHHYVRGAMHGGSAGQLASGLFCDKCGCGKPDDEPDVIVPHHPDPTERRLSS